MAFLRDEFIAHWAKIKAGHISQTQNIILITDDLSLNLIEQLG